MLLNHAQFVLHENTTEELKERAAAFLADYEAETTTYPLGRERIYGDNVLIELRFWDKKIWLSSIMTLERRRGSGGEAMVWLMQLADKHNLRIGLTPSPFGAGGMSKAVLTKWYKKLGFKLVGSCFAREPHPLG